jgi:hypothetical protein
VEASLGWRRDRPSLEWFWQQDAFEATINGRERNCSTAAKPVRPTSLIYMFVVERSLGADIFKSGAVIGYNCCFGVREILGRRGLFLILRTVVLSKTYISNIRQQQVPLECLSPGSRETTMSNPTKSPCGDSGGPVIIVCITTAG